MGRTEIPSTAANTKCSGLTRKEHRETREIDEEGASERVLLHEVKDSLRKHYEKIGKLEIKDIRRRGTENPNRQRDNKRNKT